MPMPEPDIDRADTDLIYGLPPISFPAMDALSVLEAVVVDLTVIETHSELAKSR